MDQATIVVSVSVQMNNLFLLKFVFSQQKFQLVNIFPASWSMVFYSSVWQTVKVNKFWTLILNGPTAVSSNIPAALRAIGFSSTLWKNTFYSFSQENKNKAGRYASVDAFFANSSFSCEDLISTFLQGLNKTSRWIFICNFESECNDPFNED